MNIFKASNYPFRIIERENKDYLIPYPLLLDDRGVVDIQCVSPIHGRSFIVGRYVNKKWIISKGNGLSYSTYAFLNTGKNDEQIWGMLSEENARRDFIIGKEIQNLGIKTNEMEFVLRIEKEFIDCATHKSIFPYLLQYSVECPYRICDFAFMPKDEFKQEIRHWAQMNEKSFSDLYLIAANVLIKNLRIMHDNNIMHNAVHIQNYTWALELLDFESSRTNTHPYKSLEYEKHVPMLMTGEIIQTYEVINYIAWCLNEKMSYSAIDGLFREYGFELNKFSVN